MTEAFLLDELDIHSEAAGVHVTEGYDLGESSERRVFLPLRVEAATRAAAVAKVDRIAAVVSRPRVALHYTPEGGSASVVECRRGVLKQKWNVQAEKQSVIDVDLTFPAEDYLRSPSLVTATPTSLSPVLFAAMDSATSAYTAAGGTLTSDTSSKTEGTASLRIAPTTPGVLASITRTGLTPVSFDRLLHTINVDAAAAVGGDALVTLTLLARDTGSLTLPAQRVPERAGFTELVFADDGTATVTGDFADNLLTDNQASIETDASGWINPSNCTLAQVTTTAYAGSASLRMTAVATAVSMNTQSSTFIPITAGQTMRAVARFRAATTPRDVRVLVNFYTAATAFVSQVVGTAVTDTTSGWTYVYAEGVAPATATKFAIFPYVLNVVAGEQHFIDGLGAFVDAQLPHATPITGFRLDIVTSAASVNFDRMRRMQDGAGASGLFQYSKPQGSAPTPVAFQVSQAAAIGFLLAASWPARPAGFNPALTFNTNNGTVSIPSYAYRGSFAVVAEVAAPGAAFTVTVTAGPPGGVLTDPPKQVISAPAPSGTKLVPVGFLTLPTRDVDPVNTAATSLIGVLTSGPNIGRLWLFPVGSSVLRVDLQGVSVTAPKRIFVDPPDPTTDLPRVFGSNGGAADRYDAVSLLPWAVGNLHPTLDPARPTQLYVATNDAAAVVTESHYPKWLGPRP